MMKQNTEQDKSAPLLTPAEQRGKIRQAALNLLARREHTYLELKQKLTRKFSALELIEQELNKLQEQKLLNDERFAEGFVRMRQRQGKGPRRVMQELKMRGLDDAQIAQTFQESNIDWSQEVEEVYQKKFGMEPPQTPAEKMKRQRFLATRGFSAEQIRVLANKYFKA